MNPLKGRKGGDSCLQRSKWVSGFNFLYVRVSVDIRELAVTFNTENETVLLPQIPEMRAAHPAIDAYRSIIGWDKYNRVAISKGSNSREWGGTAIDVITSAMMSCAWVTETNITDRNR